MVTALLRRELGASISRDPVTEDGLLTLELARLVGGAYPIGDFGGIAGLYSAISI
jgi:hypothetical protein